MVDEMENLEINPDLEKNREFLFNLVYKFYENQITENGSTNTVIGFLIAANGVILLGLLTIFQMIFSNNDNNLGNSTIILSFLILNLLFSCISIWTCAGYIIISRPISFYISKTPIEITNQKFSKLQEDVFDSLNAIIKINYEKLQKAQKYFLMAYVSFGFSIVMILLNVGIFIVTKGK